ncbi:hypothetical protein [Massilia sp. 9I]|uniref:hypothetical protein n=1 Tax=Massilia sp. 9I TaxID=2653152 RepID=UPI0012F0556E|nr:hypothetical protein [Massilia sp. 9I]VXB09841.1 conserved membrane hypothetical protein [Massilia sp. 9I]
MNSIAPLVNEIGADDGQKVIQLKDKLSTKLYFSSLYFVTVGVLYLWGYWPSFGINILEYIAVTDILKLTAYPIAVTLLLLLLGTSLGTIGHNREEDESLEHLSIAELEAKRLKLRRRLLFLKGGWVLSFIVALFCDTIFLWSLLPYSIAMIVMYWLRDHVTNISWLPNRNARILVVYLLVALPFLAYGKGRIAAQRVVEGTAYTYLVSGVGDSSANSKPETKMRYLGHAGEHLFFYDPKTSATVVAKMESDKPLILKASSDQIRFDEVLPTLRRHALEKLISL